jgi:quercetin dioxygenase-like cupin family protein
VSIYRWDSITPLEVNPGTKARIVTGDALQVVRVELQPDIDYPPHSHPHEQIIVVLEGRLEAIVDGTTEVVEAGGVIHIPSNVVHGVRMLDVPAVTLEMFSPPRISLSHSDPK